MNNKSTYILLVSTTYDQLWSLGDGKLYVAVSICAYIISKMGMELVLTSRNAHNYSQLHYAYIHTYVEDVALICMKLKFILTKTNRIIFE